jgi:hypothetical protein
MRWTQSASACATGKSPQTRRCNGSTTRGCLFISTSVRRGRNHEPRKLGHCIGGRRSPPCPRTQGFAGHRGGRTGRPNISGLDAARGTRRSARRPAGNYPRPSRGRTNRHLRGPPRHRQKLCLLELVRDHRDGPRLPWSACLAGRYGLCDGRRPGRPRQAHQRTCYTDGANERFSIPLCQCNAANAGGRSGVGFYCGAEIARRQ